MKQSRSNGVIASIAVAEIVGLLSGLFAGDQGAIYDSISLPPLAPSGWVFPVMWVIFYACMGVAANCVYTAATPADMTQRAIAVYAAQLFVNFWWSIIFFRFERFGWALIVILLLDALVLWTIRCFAKIRLDAAYLLVPYLAWLLFATYLNIGVCLLN